jgi:Zn-dependent protease with chaperone function
MSFWSSRVSVLLTTLIGLNGTTHGAASGFWQQLCSFGSSFGWEKALLHTPTIGLPLSPENEALCRDILEQAGIDNFASITISSCETSIHVSSDGLFVDEELFDMLSLDTQTAIIAHEAMHLKHEHLLKRACFDTAAYMTSLCLQCALLVAHTKYIHKIKNKTLKKFLNAPVVRMLGHASLFCITYVLPLIAYSWSQELEADREAMKLFNCAQATAEFFKFSIACTAAHNRQEGRWHALTDYITSRFTHPPDAWRVAQAENMLPG